MAFAGCAPAFAQDEQASAPTPEAAAPADIIITARKRGETQLEAPATIQVVFPKLLDQRAVTSASQLNGIVAGLTQSSGGPASLPSTNFRGVGSNAALFGNESSVAMYQDGVYLGHARDYETPLYDVDHVEFIKGTQSTLLGKNTTLGAISVVNRRPEDGFHVDMSYKHNFGVEGDQVNAMVNVPLSNTLTMRLAGLADRDEGYTFNVATDRNEAESSDLSGRAIVKWEPNTALNVLLTYQHEDRTLKGQYLEVLSDPIGAIALRARAVGQDEFDGIGNRRSYAASDAFNGAPAGPLPGETMIDNRLNLVANWDVGPFTLTSQTAYIRWNDHSLNDNDHVAAHLYDYDDVEKNREFTQEFRLSSPTTGKFSYLVGLYYYYDNWALERNLTYYSPVGVIPNQPAGADQGVLGRSRGTTDNIFNSFVHSYSAFASATYHFTKRLDVLGGVRETLEHKTASLERFGTGFIGTTSYTPIPLTDYSREDKAFDYDFGIQYHPVDDLMLYATHSKGSKSGGFQEFPTSAATDEYADERAFTNEVGGKYNLHGLGNFSLAVFRTTIRGFQTNYTTQLFGVQQTVTGNSDLRTQGVEFTGLVRPFSNFSLSGNVVYADAKYLTYLNGTTPQTAATFPGMRAPKAPLWSGRFDADYAAPLNAVYELNLHGGMSFNSKAFSQPPNFSSVDSPIINAYQEFDARIGIRNKEQGWELAVVGTNLTNVTYVTFAARIAGDTTPAVQSPGIGQRSYFGAVNKPRTVGIQFTLHR